MYSAVALVLWWFMLPGRQGNKGGNCWVHNGMQGCESEDAGNAQALGVIITYRLWSMF